MSVIIFLLLVRMLSSNIEITFFFSSNNFEPCELIFHRYMEWASMRLDNYGLWTCLIRSLNIVLWISVTILRTMESATDKCSRVLLSVFELTFLSDWCFNKIMENSFFDLVHLYFPMVEWNSLKIEKLLLNMVYLHEQIGWFFFCWLYYCQDKVLESAIIYFSYPLEIIFFEFLDIL